MSLYAQLTRGPVRATVNRKKKRTNDIYSQLTRSRANRTTATNNTYTSNSNNYADSSSSSSSSSSHNNTTTTNRCNTDNDNTNNNNNNNNSNTSDDDNNGGNNNNNNNRNSNSNNANRNRNRRRRRRRAAARDRDLERNRIADKEEKERLERMERELEEDREKLRLDAERVAELKKTILMVEKTYLHVHETTKEHHTDRYACTDGFFGELVVRRGQEFKITFTFQRPWSGKQDDLCLVFGLGETPKEGNGTLIKVKLEEGKDTSYMEGKANERSWGARILHQEGNELTVSVYTPPHAVIGQWTFNVITYFTDAKGKRTSVKLDDKDEVAVLLNPWCKDDQVYFEEEKLLDEYILNENGCVFNGSHSSIGKKSWFYGQFQDRILDISLHILRKGFEYDIVSRMGDAVYIARALSRILNSSDDNGVLTGNWSGNYDGGKKPTSWKGSVGILEQYMAGGQPVKYGQCWVFSHVLTTVARAIGLPCRSVTNFSSAHDTDLTLTIDRFLDENGDIIKWQTSDSIWNFHVWNEVWLMRKDLDFHLNCNGKYDGWHAIDATPQETSDSLYQCGPSPVNAILYGDVQVGFDTRFIFAEVNSEVCNWREEGGELLLVDKDRARVGRHISTKVPNGSSMNSSFFATDSDNRLDITNTYKHEEGSVAEREAVQRALCGTKYCHKLFANESGVELSFLPIESPKLGKDVTATMKVTNGSSKAHSLRLKVTVRPMTYWGEVIGDKVVASHLFPNTTVQPNDSATFDLSIKADDYLSECDEHLAMSVLGMVFLHDDDHPGRVFGSEDFIIQAPPIQVKGPHESVDVEDTIYINIDFTNPLNKTLTNCQLEIEGGVLVLDEDFTKKHAVYTKKLDNVKPNENVTMEVKVKANPKPRKSFEREIEIGFACDQLPDLEGCVNIQLLKD